MSVSDKRYDSFLLVDCGTTTTTVALFDLVENGYRLIARAAAPTTARSPWSDVLVGIQQAIRRISEITGRSLITENGDLIRPAKANGAGVDRFGMTVSAAAPLRLITSGLLDDVSLASARRAARSTYVQELDTFSLGDPRSEEEQIKAILDKRPEIILLTGGTDSGDTGRLSRILEMVEMGTGLLNGKSRPHVIYAGNNRMREKVTEALGSLATVHVAENVRPDLGVERLTDTTNILNELYDDLKVGLLPGIHEAENWSRYPLLPTARAFSMMIEYFAALYDSRVMGLDVGSNSVTMSVADQEGVKTLVDSNLGMGQPLVNLLDVIPYQEILHWSPFAIGEQAVQNFVRDKVLHPYTVPMTEEDHYLEQAMVRKIIEQVVTRAANNWGWPSSGAHTLPSLNLLVLRGSTLAQQPRFGQSILLALDALQPTGIFSVAADRHGVLPMLGLLAAYEPSAVVQILEGGVMVELGWVIAPFGKGEPGKKAVRITVESAEKGEYRIDAEFGELINVPLATGVPAQLTVQPARGVDVGFGPGRSKKITVHGGAVGLVVDCRGRPLRLPKDESERNTLLRQWQWDMGG